MEEYEIGKEYDYLGQPVKLIRIEGEGKWADAMVETRGLMRTRVHLDELGVW